MKKLSFSLLLALMLLALTASAVLAADNAANDKGRAGKSNNQFLYLYEKDPADWTFVWDGAWGKLKCNVAGSTFDYVLHGHGLSPETGYSLIYYADPWPGDNPGALIASGVSNDKGDILLKGSAELNMDLVDAKLWLVTSDDYDATNAKLVGWHPADYLFEHHAISYDDLDV